MCFVFIWEQTATCATYNLNWLVFITEMESVYCAVRTGSLNKAVCASSWNSEKTYIVISHTVCSVPITLTSTAEKVLSIASGISTSYTTLKQAVHCSLSRQTSRRWSMICRKRYVKQTAMLDKKSLSMYNDLPPAIAYLAKQLLQKHTQTLYTNLHHFHYT